MTWIPGITHKDIQILFSKGSLLHGGNNSYQNDLIVFKSLINYNLVIRERFQQSDRKISSGTLYVNVWLTKVLVTFHWFEWQNETES